MFTEGVLDFEEALYQSGFEWDYENEKKKQYKIYLDNNSEQDFIKQMKNLGDIKFNDETFNTGNGFKEAKKVIK